MTIRVRPRSGDARITPALWAAAVLVGVAILKPWGAGSPEPTRAPIAVRPTAISITPEPTEDRTPDGLASAICLGAGTWQVASLENWRTQEVRVWRAIKPIAAAQGPDDPAIPSVPIVAVGVGGLGWCAPSYGANRPVGPATVTAWYVHEDLVTDLRLRQVLPVDGVTPLGALYRPLGACPEQMSCAPLPEAPVPEQWVSGRVVFRYLDGGGASLWFAAELEINPPRGGPATSPVAPPGQGPAR